MSIQTIIPIEKINFTRLRGGEKFRTKENAILIYDGPNTGASSVLYPLTFRYEDTTDQGLYHRHTYTKNGCYYSFSNSPRDLEGLIVTTYGYDYLLKWPVEASTVTQTPPARLQRSPKHVPVSIEGLKVGSKVRLHDGDVLTLDRIKDDDDDDYNYVFQDEDGCIETYNSRGYYYYLGDPETSLNVAEIIHRATDVVRLDAVKVGNRLRLRDGTIRTVTSIHDHLIQVKVPCAEGFYYDLSGKINFRAHLPNEEHHSDVLEILPPAAVDLSECNLKPGIKAATRDGRLLVYEGFYDRDRDLIVWRCENPSGTRLYHMDGQRYMREACDDIVEVLAPLSPNADV